MKLKEASAIKRQELSFQSAKLKQRIAKIFAESLENEAAAQDVAFHFTDWEDDIVSLICLYQNPNDFSDEDVLMELLSILAHLPNHMAAAKKLGGMGPIQDVFEVGVFEEDND
jgi:hypothetical protein